MTISLSISHTPWIPERVESFERLRTQLIESGWPWEEGPVHVEDGKAPNWEWSGRMWKHAVKMGADWCLFLQDDVTVCPAFPKWIDAMLAFFEGPGMVVGWDAEDTKVRPANIGAICLEVVHPAAQVAAAAGHPWFTTRDGVVGVGYLMPRKLLEEFLAWREARLEACKGINEDTLLGVWHLITGRNVLHPVPTPIDHDVELASTYPGNEAHANRRPLVRWDTFAGKLPGQPSEQPPDGTDPEHWRFREDIPHLGIFPGWTLPHLARGAFPDDYSETQCKLDLLDNGHTELLKLLDGKPWCFMCTRRVALARANLTGVGVCGQCVREVLQAVIPG